MINLDEVPDSWYLDGHLDVHLVMNKGDRRWWLGNFPGSWHYWSVKRVRLYLHPSLITEKRGAFYSRYFPRCWKSQPRLLKISFLISSRLPSSYETQYFHGKPMMTESKAMQTSNEWFAVSPIFEWITSSCLRILALDFMHISHLFGEPFAISIYFS